MLRKIILNILIVAAVVFVLDFAVGRTLRYFYFKEMSGLQFRTTYSMEKTNADILIFGSSRANHHYVPEVFEDSLKMPYYNTGRDGNGIFYQTAILKSVLKRYTPKVIILDYAGGFYKEQNYYDRLSSLLPYYENHEEIRSIIALKGPYEKLKLVSQIYPFNSTILTIALGNTEFNKRRKPDNKGYIALHKEWNLEIDSIKTSTTYAVDTNKVNSFEEFISIAKKSGANIFVVYSPIFQKFDRKPEIEICDSICISQDVPFYDFSQDTLFLNNRQLFQDPSHLNHNGATIFSNIIVKRIKREAVLN
jgi:hypothetical protein